MFVCFIVIFFQRILKGINLYIFNIEMYQIYLFIFIYISYSIYIMYIRMQNIEMLQLFILFMLFLLEIYRYMILIGKCSRNIIGYIFNIDRCNLSNI